MSSGRVRLGTLIALSFVSAALLVDEAAAAFPGGNGKIAFIRFAETTGEGEVFVVDPDGSGETNLTGDFRGDVWSASWSPDGSRIAFLRGIMQPDDHDFPSRWQLYVMNADGSGKTRLTAFWGFLPEAAWAPDGTVIAFPRAARRSIQLFTIRPDGTGLRRLTDFRRLLVLQPSWSPDGRTIAFANFELEPQERIRISAVNADGGGLRRLTRGRFDLDPDWSPDGSRIVFDSGGALAVVQRDGSGRRLLLPASDQASDVSPSWSPDGTKVVMVTDRWGSETEGGAIGIANADGTCPTRVIFGGFSPSWQPVPGGAPSPELRCADVVVDARVHTRWGLVGEPFTLSVTVENRGNEAAPDVRVFLPLPRYLRLVSATPGTGTCGTPDGPVRCELGTLAPGAGARVDLVVVARRAVFRDLPSVAAMTSADDPDPSTNVAEVRARICSRRGTARRDVLVGGPGFDVICAFGGNDQIRGADGRDLVLAGAGDDRVRGGRGDETIQAGPGNDAIDAGPGGDYVAAGPGDDSVRGGRGRDWIEGGPGDDLLLAGRGDDSLDGGRGSDRLFGGPGDDHFDDYDRARDFVDGGPGRDFANLSRRDVVRRVETVYWMEPSRVTGGVTGVFCGLTRFITLADQRRKGRE